MKFFILFLLILSAKSWALNPSRPAEDTFFQNVVYIDVESQDKKGEPVLSGCNATLISNQLAVTAAHCLSEGWLSHTSIIHIQIGKYRYVNRKGDGKRVRVGYANFYDAHVPAQFLFTQSLQSKISQKYFNEIPPHEDIALIQFLTPLPLDDSFVYAHLLSWRDLIKFRDKIPQGTLGSVSINYAAEVSTTDTKRIAFFDDVHWHRGWLISHSLSRVEEGDSGSPIFVRVGGTFALAGVVKGRAKTVIANWDVFAPAAFILCQLSSEFQINPQLLCP